MTDPRNARDHAARRAHARHPQRPVVGHGTDLRFTIEGIGAVPCEGCRTLPDGECFSAPVKDEKISGLALNPERLLGAQGPD